jgi:hypothetical protein
MANPLNQLLLLSFFLRSNDGGDHVVTPAHAYWVAASNLECVVQIFINNY